mmetsp:Transcript_97491/g.232059  ORF Transcript_97491/g.232059 Transcript_97491/m.232059 type:complete len:484 (+) Transcript_97491:47-1498(+)
MEPLSPEREDSASEEDTLPGCLGSMGIVCEKPSVRCFLQNLQNVACGLIILCVVGAVFVATGWAAGDGKLMTQSLLLCVCALGAFLVVGTDPCFLNHLRDSVARLSWENRRLKSSNEKLERELQELDAVSRSLEEVHRQMGNDADAAQELLKGLHKQSTVQAVSSSMGLFFAADIDKSGVLAPEEAMNFLMGFSHLWDVVPDYPMDKLEAMDTDLDVHTYSQLLQAVIAEDAATCRKILDQLCSDPVEARVQMARVGASFKPRPVDEESGPDTEDEMTPCLTLGPLEIWGAMHCAAILLTMLALIFWVTDALTLSPVALSIATLLLMLGLGLALQGQLLVIARELRSHMLDYNKENKRLMGSVETLAGQVTHLRNLEKGLEDLEQKFGGNVSQAQKLIKREIATSKMQLVSVSLEMFSRADVDANGLLEGEELDEFFEPFDHVCKNLGIDNSQTKATAYEQGLPTRELHELVDQLLKMPSGRP